MDWGRRIREYRKLRGLKQEAIAFELGVDRSTISRWETGRDEPALALRQRIIELTPDTNEATVRALVDAIDNLEGYATLLDQEFRVLRTSRAHQRALGHDPTEIYGQPSERYWSAQMERVIKHLGGLRGYRRHGIYRMDLTIRREPNERGARNRRPIITVGRTVAIGDPRKPTCHMTTLRFLEEGEAAPPCVIIGLDGEIPIAE